jgi:hypothetical protein
VNFGKSRNQASHMIVFTSSFRSPDHEAKLPYVLAIPGVDACCLNPRNDSVNRTGNENRMNGNYIIRYAFIGNKLISDNLELLILLFKTLNHLEIVISSLLSILVEYFSILFF